MIDVTIHDIDGRLLQSMTLRNVTEANENAGAGQFWVTGKANLTTDMVDVVDGLILPRPMLAAPPTSGVAPLAIDLSVYPVGSTFTARNTEGDEITIIDLSQPLTLIDAGVYQISISPPWPWMALDHAVEVTNA